MNGMNVLAVVLGFISASLPTIGAVLVILERRLKRLTPAAHDKHAESFRKWERVILIVTGGIALPSFILALVLGYQMETDVAALRPQLADTKGWQMTGSERARFIAALKDASKSPAKIESSFAEKEPYLIGSQLVGVFELMQWPGRDSDFLDTPIDHEGIIIFSRQQSGPVDAMQRAFKVTGRNARVEIDPALPDENMRISIGRWPTSDGNPAKK